MAGDRHVPRADDAALVREVAAGSQDALAALYDRYVDAVFAASIRLTSDRQVAEEVVQETFLALWNRAELFNPSMGSLAAWLHTIARNRTVDRLRAAGRRPNLVPLSSATGNDEGDAAALDRIVLAYREELTQTEIAERLGWPLGTVKTRTRRALLRLREALADELGPSGARTAVTVPVT